MAAQLTAMRHFRLLLILLAATKCQLVAAQTTNAPSMAPTTHSAEEKSESSLGEQVWEIARLVILCLAMVLLLYVLVRLMRFQEQLAKPNGLERLHAARSRVAACTIGFDGREGMERWSEAGKRESLASTREGFWDSNFVAGWSLVKQTGTFEPFQDPDPEGVEWPPDGLKQWRIAGERKSLLGTRAGVWDPTFFAGWSRVKQTGTFEPFQDPDPEGVEWPPDGLKQWHIAGERKSLLGTRAGVWDRKLSGGWSEVQMSGTVLRQQRETMKAEEQEEEQERQKERQEEAAKEKEKGEEERQQARMENDAKGRGGGGGGRGGEGGPGEGRNEKAKHMKSRHEVSFAVGFQDIASVADFNDEKQRLFVDSLAAALLPPSSGAGAQARIATVTAGSVNVQTRVEGLASADAASAVAGRVKSGGGALFDESVFGRFTVSEPICEVLDEHPPPAGAAEDDTAEEEAGGSLDQQQQQHHHHPSSHPPIHPRMHSFIHTLDYTFACTLRCQSGDVTAATVVWNYCCNLGPLASGSSAKVVVWDNDGGFSDDERLGEVAVPLSYPGVAAAWLAMSNLGSDNPGGGRVQVSYSYY